MPAKKIPKIYNANFTECSNKMRTADKITAIIKNTFKISGICFMARLGNNINTSS